MDCGILYTDNCLLHPLQWHMLVALFCFCPHSCYKFWLFVWSFWRYGWSVRETYFGAKWKASKFNVSQSILLPTRSVEADHFCRPVGLKEASLDSPTFRATILHFSEQVDAVEKWLDGYIKATAKLSHEVSTLENLVNGFLTYAVPPAYLSEAIIDHDYTLLAIKRYGDGAREFWNSTVMGIKKLDSTMVDPMRNFLQNELRNFKVCRIVSLLGPS